MGQRILRDADWLGAPRARAWCKVLAAVSILIAAAYIATVNAGHGQNGFLSAALFALFMVSGRFPLLGGACLGVLSFKPQLALAVPVALIAGRRWAALAAAIFSASALAGASWLVLGQKAWVAFLSSTPLARDMLEHGLVDPAKMVSLFSALRLIHVPLGLAYLAQGLVAMCTLRILVRVARRRPGNYAEGATLAAVTCLCTPFLLDYDLTILALPIAFVASEAIRTGWRRWEKIVLLAAYALPLVARPFAMLTGVGVAPLVIGSLLVVVVRRAYDGSGRGSSNQG